MSARENLDRVGHAPSVGHNSAACTLCSSTDPDGLVELLAEELWESRQDDTQWARRWADAGDLWHIRFRELARTAIGFLERSPTE
ncbi:hypothetical protein EV292_10161 [Sphingomonas sp. BK235]|nr:hypothetical protein EV292_10161 [Sphingomonas sp. BK235]